MKQFIRGVLPIGAPWGGPESIRFISCLSSLYVYLKQPDKREELLFCPHSGELCDDCGQCGNHDRLRRMHEQVYFELLTLSGLNCRTHWDPEFRPQFLTDLLLETTDDDPIERAMAFAGFEYRMVEALPPEAFFRAVNESLSRNVPVPACRAAGDDWCLITGCDDDGKSISGFYFPQEWDSPENRPDTLHGGEFTSKEWVRQGTRLLVVTGDCPARVPDREEFSRLRELLIESDCRECVTGLAAFDRCIELLQDETFFAAADREKLDRCAAHMLRFFEQLAELRGNAALTFFSGFFGKLHDPELARLGREIGALFLDSRDRCRRLLDMFHSGNRAALLRNAQVRIEVINALKKLKKNDWNAVLLLEALEDFVDSE